MKQASYIVTALKSLIVLVSFVTMYAGCRSSAAENINAAPPPMQLPVLEVGIASANTYQEYPASLEGKVNVEIRAQVDGYLENIFVEEGAFVRAGQPLFRINDLTYREQLSNASASLIAAKANMQKAAVEVERLRPLVESNVVAEVKLKTAEAEYNAAKAQADQAKSVVGNAQITLGYTTIKAPVSGYIGRIPFKTGSLVGRGEAQALTVLSDVSEIYAYFSLSEIDFMRFKNRFEGATIEEKLKKVPPVELVLPDNSIYEGKGVIQNVDGQLDKTMGSITFRAKFPNAGRILRTGNTGKVRLGQVFSTSILVPQDATFEIQDKVFVFAVGDSNKVYSKPLQIAGKSPKFYFVDKGLEKGEKIVLSGIGNLRDGMVISPQVVKSDSVTSIK